MASSSARTSKSFGRAATRFTAIRHGRSMHKHVLLKIGVHRYEFARETMLQFFGWPKGDDVMRILLVLVIFLLTLLVGSESTGADWTQFRGPSGDGHSDGKTLPTTWGGFLEPPDWKTSLPGTGWSSPIVIGDRIWVTAAEMTALNASALTAKLAEHPYGEIEFQTHDSVTLLAVELDAKSGAILRRLDLLEEENPTAIHVVNSYASPTPVTDGERVYCDFGSLGTVGFAIESGEIIWRQRFVVDDITGPASSPVLCDNCLILVRDGCDEQYVVALNKFSGDVIWRQQRPKIDAVDDKHRRGFSTPLLIQNAGQKQIIAPTAQWVVSYAPATGEELWKARLATGHAVVPRPVYAHGLVYICSGYHKSQLAAVRVNGTGDVTDTHIEWTYDRQVPLIASPIVAGGEIYFVSTAGIATCLDAITGERLWRQRLPGNFAASPLLADGKLYFTSTEGITTVLRPGREYHELAQNRLYGQTMASIAVGDGALLIRTSPILYCVRSTDSPPDGRFGKGETPRQKDG